jgi:hypothetical protein
MKYAESAAIIAPRSHIYRAVNRATCIAVGTMPTKVSIANDNAHVAGRNSAFALNREPRADHHPDDWPTWLAHRRLGM